MLGDQIASWATPFAPVSRLDASRRARLRRLVRHAARSVPFYTRRFQEHGYDPFACDEVDLAQVPLTPKLGLKSAPVESRLSSGVDLSKCIRSETSGSTGEPMLIAHTHTEAARLYGRRLRAQMLGGLRPWHRRVVLGSQPKWRWPHRLGLFRIDAVALDLQPSEAFDRLGAIRPQVLRGPPSSLERLAEADPDRLRELGLQVVFSGAEQLSARARRLIRQAAGCEVLDFYGASECNLIAWECAKCGAYHTCDDSVIVEVLQDGRPVGPGGEGEVYITVLDGYAMPFIRYEVGDVVRLPAKTPDCSIRFGAIESIEGRFVDYLRFGDGRDMSPYLLMNPLDELHQLRRYEVEQLNRHQIRARIQVEPGCSVEAVKAEVERRCRQVIPPGVGIEVAVVEQFALDPDQKRRFVRSAVETHA